MLEGKIILLTGGSRGIGEAIAHVLADYGAHVAFTYHSSADRALAVEEALKSKGSCAKAYRSDAARFAESEELVQQVLKDYDRIDALINNAGITRDNLLMRMSEEQWDAVIETNLKSIFNLTKQVLRPMMKQKSGSLIHMSSIVGIGGNAGQANYAASKAGIIGFSKSVAKELGSRNIRSNVIAPGFIETEMTHGLPEDKKAEFMAGIPLRRMGQGADVAELTAFLASDRSAYITGQVISVCGGLSV